MVTLCQSGAAIIRAGANVSDTLNASGGMIEDFITQAESYINVATRKNWTDGYTGYDADLKFILEELAANIAAMYCIQYDMSGYTSRAEAQTMLDVLRDKDNDALNILKQKENQEIFD